MSAFEPVIITSPFPEPEEKKNHVAELAIYLPNQIRCDVKMDLRNDAFATLLKQLVFPDNIKVHLYCGVTDMRKSINTLAIMVQDVLQMAPTSGHLFLFRSRGGDKLKALYYEEHGFTLWYRRLDKGKFIFPRNIHGHLELTPEHFKWLLASNKFVHYQGESPPIYGDFY